MTTKSDLVRAGALIIAEIERLDRKARLSAARQSRIAQLESGEVKG